MIANFRFARCLDNFDRYIPKQLLQYQFILFEVLLDFSIHHSDPMELLANKLERDGIIDKILITNLTNTLSKLVMFLKKDELPPRIEYLRTNKVIRPFNYN